MTDLSPIHIIRPKTLPFSDAESEVRRRPQIHPADEHSRNGRIAALLFVFSFWLVVIGACFAHAVGWL